jgi:predicted RNA methylase
MIVTHYHQPKLLPIAFNGGEIAVMTVPLRRDDPSSPWCYSARLTPTIPIIDDDDDDDDYSSSQPTPTSSKKTTLPPGANFLATQVWPSSRAASVVIERSMDPSWTVCELGCGPGLPSLTAARRGARRVIATDVDEVALEMVRAAAIEQGFVEECDDKVEGRRFVTMKFDLTSRERPFPRADLYILSDVFESSAVAEGAAWHVQNVLSGNRRETGVNGEKDEGGGDISRVWVFAQSDRAQRDFFLDKMREWYEHGVDDERRQLMGWSMNHAPDHDDELWLFDLDETTVDYN